jgi:hypothetical protein
MTGLEIYQWQITYKNDEDEIITKKTKEFQLKEMENTWVLEEMNYLKEKAKQKNPKVELVKKVK